LPGPGLPVGAEQPTADAQARIGPAAGQGQHPHPRAVQVRAQPQRPAVPPLHRPGGARVQAPAGHGQRHRAHRARAHLDGPDAVEQPGRLVEGLLQGLAAPSEGRADELHIGAHRHAEGHVDGRVASPARGGLLG
ncbi:MAG: hypothetical protein ACK559_32835, partial [bacterium]